jgi:hypothetical protein
MSVLVALKMEGRFAGAILTVVSLVGRDDGRKMSRFRASRVGYIFLGRELQQAELCDFGTQIQFCGVPRQGLQLATRISRPSPAAAAKLIFVLGKKGNLSRHFADRGIVREADSH